MATPLHPDAHPSRRSAQRINPFLLAAWRHNPRKVDRFLHFRRILTAVAA
jgi:hypothetical protein